MSWEFDLVKYNHDTTPETMPVLQRDGLVVMVRYDNAGDGVVEGSLTASGMANATDLNDFEQFLCGATTYVLNAIGGSNKVVSRFLRNAGERWPRIRLSAGSSTTNYLLLVAYPLQ